MRVFLAGGSGAIGVPPARSIEGVILRCGFHIAAMLDTTAPNCRQ